ncbi:MAG: hypothetical protein HY319_28595 [Armatimonadetes bacterium]|nr:hypothetical protein [Armatimonadota bacterium]
MERWSTDSQGRYPANLMQLTPDYLGSIPTCPTGRGDAYSRSYQSAARADAFPVFCQGGSCHRVRRAEA